MRPEDVTLESEIDDLDAVRKHFGLGSAAIPGHAWGTVLALEYAIRHPDRVSRLILMNPAPASRDDDLLLRKEHREKWGCDPEQLKAMSSTRGYPEGDPDAVAAHYRIHFRAALARPEDLERVLKSLRVTLKACGHFSCLECPDAVGKDIQEFFQGAGLPARAVSPSPAETTGAAAPPRLSAPAERTLRPRPPARAWG